MHKEGGYQVYLPPEMVERIKPLRMGEENLSQVSRRLIKLGAKTLEKEGS